MKRLMLLIVLTCLANTSLGADRIKGIIQDITASSIQVGGVEYPITHDAKVTLGRFQEVTGDLFLIPDGAEVYIYIENRGDKKGKVTKLQMIGTSLMIEKAKSLMP